MALPINASGINFSQANSNCTQLGAQLVSIHSVAENAFVTGKVLVNHLNSSFALKKLKKSFFGILYLFLILLE